MENQGNHRENQQQVDQPTRNMKCNETEKPQNKKNGKQYQKHRFLLSAFQKDVGGLSG
jgi:hypothetical protein